METCWSLKTFKQQMDIKPVTGVNMINMTVTSGNVNDKLRKRKVENSVKKIEKHELEAI